MGVGADAAPECNDRPAKDGGTAGACDGAAAVDGGGVSLPAAIQRMIRRRLTSSRLIELCSAMLRTALVAQTREGQVKWAQIQIGKQS